MRARRNEAVGVPPPADRSGKLRCDFVSDTADRLVVCVPDAECVAAPGRLHAIKHVAPASPLLAGRERPLQRLNAVLGDHILRHAHLGADDDVGDPCAGHLFDHSDQTKRAPRSNSMMPRLPHHADRQSRYWKAPFGVSRRCDSFIYGTRRPADGARPPDGSRAAAATRRTASRARCRAGSRACRRRAPAGWARPGRQSLRDPPGLRCG